MLKRLIYLKGINSFLRTLLKPFSRQLPVRYKFPIHGTFTVRGKDIPPFRITSNPTSYFTKKVFWDNVEGFEYSSVKIFCALVKNSHVFFDIGSNIGYYSLLASAIRQKNIKVYAFEPMPSVFDYLEKNIQLNGFDNIRPQAIALSNEQGSSTFYSIRNEKFRHFPQLTGDGGLSNTQSGNRTQIRFDVTINTLDAFVKSHPEAGTIDLIKLDTEANEHFVLMGASEVLRTHRPIIQCEILKGHVESQVEEVLRDYNYLYYKATDKGLIPVTNFLNNTSHFVDYYLVPIEKQNLIQSFIA